MTPELKSALHRCTWCGHVHDPEDGRCDAHAHVGIGHCPCPGDLRTLRYERERVRRRIERALDGESYSVSEMAHDLERFTTHPVWEQAEKCAFSAASDAERDGRMTKPEARRAM